MIDHMTVTVSDAARSRAFYEKVLQPLGGALHMEYAEFMGFGQGRPSFWIKAGRTPTQPMHIAFIAPDRQAVDEFHDAALEAGARDDGEPGLRPDYHQHYYAAFVIDPDGHHLEAVCHEPPPPPASSVKRTAPAKTRRAAPAKKAVAKRKIGPKKAAPTRASRTRR